MTKLIIIFLGIFILGTIPAVALDFYSGSDFLDKFMQEKSLSLMGTILAIYIAMSASFIAILNNYENEQGKNIFSKTVKELKMNIVFIFIVFVLHFFLLAGTSKSFGLILDLVFKLAKTFTFLLFLYALYELSNALFTVNSKLPKKDKR